MTKSTIRISLRKPQATRHVCPTSGRAISFKYECAAPPIIAFVRLSNWVKTLVNQATEDGKGEDAWQAPHSVSLEFQVSADGTPGSYVGSVCMTMSCSQVVLLTRYLSRFDEEVWLRKRKLDDAPYWQIFAESLGNQGAKLRELVDAFPRDL